VRNYVRNRRLPHDNLDNQPVAQDQLGPGFTRRVVKTNPVESNSARMFYERWSITCVERTRGLDAQALRMWAHRLVSELAVQDWFVFIYLLVLSGAVAAAPASPERTTNLHQLVALLVWLVVTLVAVRGGILARSTFASLLYRLSLLGTTLASYFMLRSLLPIVNTGALDAPLYRFDLAVFGFEPTLWMDQFVTPQTTEWFAFFYYSYFFLIAAYVLPMVLLCRRMKLFAEFSLGFLGVYLFAHIIYMLVPGYGPFRFLADQFQNPLPLGFWYERVLEAVNGAGAQKDIFPSLHTGGPTVCFLFALRHRKTSPFKYTWVVTGFFAANIIIATMFLRWHYLIDIIAGLTLATLASVAAAAIANWEHNVRLQRALQPVWFHLLPARKPSASLDTSSESQATS
jgi:hypothetical protein